MNNIATRWPHGLRSPWHSRSLRSAIATRLRHGPRCPLRALLPTSNATTRQPSKLLLAAPLDAILANIERKDIAHVTPELPTPPPAPPAAVLSPPSRPPLSYADAVLSTVKGGARMTPLVVASSHPSAVDGNLRTVRPRAQPCLRTGRRNCP